MGQWTYGGNRVWVHPAAEIPRPYRQNDSKAHIVQAALNSMDPWVEDDRPIHTIAELKASLPELVVPIEGATVRWGKYVGHRTKQVQVSPFVDVSPTSTDSFTVELVGSAGAPELVRAYPGEYQPPLPWQRSARNAYGGMKACRDFWRTHAYVLRSGLIIPDSETDEVPGWFSA